MAGNDEGDGTLYTLREAARRKGVSYETVSRAVRAGRLPVHRLGRHVLIGAADLAAWAPMVSRAPHKFRRAPDPSAAAAPVDATTLDRVELERRVAALAAALAGAAPVLGDGALRALADRLIALAADLPGAPDPGRSAGAGTAPPIVPGNAGSLDDASADAAGVPVAKEAGRDG